MDQHHKCEYCMEAFHYEVESMKAPIVALDCGHTMCRQCLTRCFDRQRAEKRRKVSTIACPSCKVRDSFRRDSIPNIQFCAALKELDKCKRELKECKEKLAERTTAAPGGGGGSIALSPGVPGMTAAAAITVVAENGEAAESERDSSEERKMPARVKAEPDTQIEAERSPTEEEGEELPRQDDIEASSTSNVARMPGPSNEESESITQSNATTHEQPETAQRQSTTSSVAGLVQLKKKSSSMSSLQQLQDQGMSKAQLFMVATGPPKSPSFCEMTKKSNTSSPCNM